MNDNTSLVPFTPKILINVSIMDKHKGRIQFVSLDLDYYGKKQARLTISYNYLDNTYELKPLMKPQYTIKCFVSENEILNRYIFKWIGENAEDIIKAYF